MNSIPAKPARPKFTLEQVSHDMYEVPPDMYEVPADMYVYCDVLESLNIVVLLRSGTVRRSGGVMKTFWSQSEVRGRC